MINRKKVILYNPKAEFLTMPLALLAIGSVLDKEQFEPILIDGRKEMVNDELLAHHGSGAICFAVSVITGSPIRDAIDISQKVKVINPSISIIWGGWHTSLFPEQILRDLPFVDICVIGQGEATFKELVHNISNELSINNISGICHRAGYLIVKTNPRPMIETDNLKPVDYDLIDVEWYFKQKGIRQFDYVSSIGCLFRCAFCADPFVFGRKYKAKSALNLVAEIEYYYKRFGFSDLSFQDDTFFTYANRVEEFAKGIIRCNIRISWSATMRADQGAKLDIACWKLLKESGLRKLLIGVESGSQEMMDYLNKDINLDNVYYCANRCEEMGIAVDFPFIIGFPDESSESIEATVRVVKRLKAQSPLFQTQIFFFKPYPGSMITNRLIAGDFGLPSTTEEWASFDFNTSGIWVSPEKKQFFDRFRFYLNLTYNRKKLVFFPLQLIARWRCRFNWFKYPWEKNIAEFIPKKR
jgi:radical SAM superfamily enzyme YgiQ (UPF0313 family)